MKTRFCLLWMVLAICQMALADVHISVSDPETWSAEELRPYIGQTVIFDVPIVVCSNYGGYTVSTRRFFSPTNQARPRSTGYDNILQLNKSGAMTLNGVSDYHRCGEKIYHLRARVNSTSSLTMLGGEWRGNTRADLEAGIPDLGNYRLLICTMNLEYYLATDYPSSGSMGPRNQAQHEKQRTKINKALTRINADAYGFVEIQQGSAATQEIAEDLNKSIPGRDYSYVTDNTAVSGSYTKSGFVYDRNKLRPIGDVQMINEKVQNRKMMICFEEIATHEKFIFSVNHFKAKSGSGTGGDANQNDGQGQFNMTRCAEAQAVLDKYKTYRYDIIDNKRRITEKDILVMGDLNAYGMEDPIYKFIDAGMIDLHRAFHADSSYSYQYSGLAGYLDHAICNGTMFLQVTGVAGFHINSDELDDFTYDKSSDLSMFRCSDHDPVLVGLTLDSTRSTSNKPYFNGGNMASDSLTFYYFYTDDSEADPVVYFDIYDINGFRVCKPTRVRFTEEIFGRRTKYFTLSGDNDNLPDEVKQMLPLPSGMYILRFYYKRHVLTHKLLVQ